MKSFISKITPIEWLLDAELFYTGARCLLSNNILAPGIFLSCRTIEKYLKTFISIRTQHIPMTHDLQRLLTNVKEKKFLTSCKKNIEDNINYFNLIQNNVSYVDAPEYTKKLPFPYGYGKCDINKLDEIIFNFEKALWEIETIKGYSFSITNIATIKEVLNTEKLPSRTVVWFNKEWLLKDNLYFKQNIRRQRS
ncbi:MAG: HEPN domain-containing protein [Elusimicrobiota bacterium]